MDRLTERRPNGVVRFNVMGDSVMLRLAAYEDTGLMPEQVTSKLNALQADRDAWKRWAEAAELEIDQAKNKVFDLFEKSNQIIDDQSDFVEELQKRLSTAEKVCSAAHMYVKHINSPLCVGWDMLLDALRKWTDERRPRDEGKEG